MTKIVRTTGSNKDFIGLVKLLDAYLAIQDGEEHGFYDQFNKIDSLKNVVIVYQNNTAVSCGAFKPFEKNTVEIKRMFTLPSYRGKGQASAVLNEIEVWAKSLHHQKIILETGVKQTDAISLYLKKGFKKTKNYGQYKGIENSLCFEKTII